MYLFLPHKIFNLDLQVNKLNEILEITEAIFLFDDHQTEHIIINWRTFPNFWHHWWKEKFGRYEKMIFFFVSGGYEFLRYDTNNVLYSIGCTLSNFWKPFLLHKPLIRSFENLSGIDVVSVDNDPKFCQWSVTTSTFWSLYGLVLRWGYKIWSTHVDYTFGILCGKF